MRPRERRETSEQDLFRSRLDQIIDMKHSLVTLARTVDWGFLEQAFGAVYTDGPGQPPLPTRLMAGLHIIKYTYDLSDEVLCERWVENPYYQLFCGEEFFRHQLVLDRSSLTRWRQRMGEEKIKALLQESLSIAVKTDGVKPGARAAAAPARPQGLFAPRPRSGVHRQGQGPSPLRVRRQSLGGNHASPFQRRTVRHPCEGVAGQSLRWPYACHRDPRHGGAGWKHHPPRLHRQGLSRPQCAARLQVQGLHRRPEAAHDAEDQARDAQTLRRRARHRPSQSRAPHGP